MVLLKSETDMGLYLIGDCMSIRIDAGTERRNTHIHAAYV
jgi:hypothetical protein